MVPPLGLMVWGGDRGVGDGADGDAGSMGSEGTVDGEGTDDE